MKQKEENREDVRRIGWVVLVLATMLTLPFIGMGHFYTRGEPREALVAMAMLDQGNFILPFFQGEFAFKPPMLHWLVALFSMPQGYVSEMTARLPSALAYIAMCYGFFVFFSRRYHVGKVLIATLVLITSFEVHRAAMTCRVDMVLTAFMVGGFLFLYRWKERGYRGMPWLASLMISGAILTKGPIGAILPCAVMAVMMIVDGEKMKASDIIRKLNKLGGENGIGLLDIVENRLVGMKDRGVYETPGGTILYKAHEVLETLTLDKLTAHKKRELAITFGELVYDGQWFSPLRKALSAFVTSTQEHVTGKVRLELYKGNLINAGVWSPFSLYREDIATFAAGGDYKQSDATGFISIYGLPTKVQAIVNSEKEGE